MPLGTKTSPARRVAHAVLVRVERDEAWAERCLAAALERNPLSPADGALATELVYGTLRHLLYLNFLAERFLKRPLRKLALPARVALQMGAHQILNTRVPAHAAVNEAVSLLGSRHAHLKGTVNAVLRKISAHHDDDNLPKVEAHIVDPIEAIAVAGSHPPWLVRHIVDELGITTAVDWIAANNRKPPITVRVNPLQTDATSVIAALRVAGIEANLLEGFPSAVELRSPGRVPSLPGFSSGHFTVQDAAAQLIALVAAPRVGDIIVDTCAAPGGKSTHLAELMKNRGKVIAIDVHPQKTRLIAAHAERLGLNCIVTAAADATKLDEVEAVLRSQNVDRVGLALVDAPCSGSGTLRRNPELRNRPAPDLDALCELQDNLLNAAAAVVRPDGALVYSVCSNTAHEGSDRIRAFLRRHPHYEIAAPTDPLVRPFVAQLEGVGAVVRTWPHRHGTDGFFAARLVRRS